MRILYLPNAYSQQRQREKKDVKIYPVLMAMEAQKYLNEGNEVYWGKQYTEFTGGGNDNIKIIQHPEGLPFLSLPHPDRVFTRAKEYTSGNYKYLPGTHMQVANGCWWGKCTFCVENKTHYEVIDTQRSSTFIERERPYEVRPVEDCIAEIEECKWLGFKEVFDDSGTFPTGRWLDDFCSCLVRNNSTIPIGCNMRMVDVDYSLMRRANFRMVLFGLESANQITLDKINKGVKVEDYKYIIKAAKAGLEPHICVVFGWEWETDTDALNTLKLVHYLLKKGYAKTAQASFIYQQGFKGNESQRNYIRRIYDIAKSPEFWFNKVKDIRNITDLKYLAKGIWHGLRDYH